MIPMSKLQMLRNVYGKPLKISSGYRHPTHPVEAAKGHSNGEHTTGNCADIVCTSGSERFAIIEIALEQGFHRIGIAKNFVHIGLGGPGLPPSVIWLY